MKKIFGFTLLMVVAIASGYGQDIDKVRMQRDLEVAENILQSIWVQEQQDVGVVFINGPRNIQFDGNYIEDYGVIFHKNRGFGGHLAYDIHGENYNYNYTVVEPDGTVRQMERDSSKGDPETHYIDSRREREKAVIQRFFADYAALISQLRPEDRVTIRIKNKPASGFLALARRYSGEVEELYEYPAFSASVTKKDIDDYKSNRINELSFYERIEYVDDEKVQKEEPELELLSSLLHRLYKEDLSQSFTLRADPKYERIPGLGVIYYLGFRDQYGTTILFKGNVNIIWDNQRSGKNKTDKEDQKLSYKERYELLKQEMPQHLIEYGRILNNLEEKESLIFKVTLPKCNDCDLPGEFEFKVSKSVLDDYDSNKISLEQALKQVKSS